MSALQGRRAARPHPVRKPPWGGAGSPSSSRKQGFPLLRDTEEHTEALGPHGLSSAAAPQAQRVGTTESGAADIHRAATWHLPPALCPEHRCSLAGWITAITLSSITFP